MSGVSGMGGFNPNAIQQYQQNLFNQIDGDSDGSISQTELEQAVGNAGGTKQAADALYAKLDPNNTGGVSEQQFANILPGPPFSGQMQAQMLDYQAQGWPDSLSADGSSSATRTSSSATDPSSALAQNLFSQIDTDSDGAISKTELEQAVSNAGGTTQAADALYAKLDPSSTGNVNEQQFSSALSQMMPQPPAPPPGTGEMGGWSGDAVVQSASSSSTSSAASSSTSSTDSTSSTTSSSVTSSTTGETAQDTIAALLQELNSELSTAGSGNTAQDGLLALLNNGTNSSGASASGTTAQDALYALLHGSNSASSTNTDGTSASGTSTGDTSSSGSTKNAALAYAISLYQAQLSQQMFGGLFGTSSGA